MSDEGGDEHVIQIDAKAASEEGMIVIDTDIVSGIHTSYSRSIFFICGHSCCFEIAVNRVTLIGNTTRVFSPQKQIK
jgi:hypothetical protein